MDLWDLGEGVQERWRGRSISGEGFASQDPSFRDGLMSKVVKGYL
jgi:hypothetical protein